jgi:thiamine kinase-like enzyme
LKIEPEIEHYLKDRILPRIASPPYGTIEVRRLSHKMPVLLLNDRTSHARLVSKSFQYGAIPLETAWQRAEKEFANLEMVRDRYGMNEGDFRIVEPLGKEKRFAAMLLIEFGQGHTLDHYIDRAILNQETDKLCYKLRLLAGFLVKLHHNSQSDRHPVADTAQHYLKKLLSTLRSGLLDEKEEKQFKELAAGWWSQPAVFSDFEVIVHGDATPTNFLFKHDKVTGIDLEKMKWADRCWDLGFLAAELKHNYLKNNQSGWAAESCIRHLLLEYSAGFHDLEMFRKITRRLPLYMALGLLRIARNEWLAEKHRRNLIDEAKLCLQYRP